MRLPIWKPKSMLSQAIAQESQEQVLEAARRDVFVRLLEQYECGLAPSGRGLRRAGGGS
jgi:hypothetical protein